MIPELGVCYYREHWPAAQWATDAKQMREIGLSLIRNGETAGSRIDPSPGDFKWGWLNKVIDVLGGAGLKVFVGTPTATSPRWMVYKRPNMIAIDKSGHHLKFGSRRHYCFSHEGYTNYDNGEISLINNLTKERLF